MENGEDYFLIQYNMSRFGFHFIKHLISELNICVLHSDGRFVKSKLYMCWINKAFLHELKLCAFSSEILAQR